MRTRRALKSVDYLLGKKVSLAVPGDHGDGCDSLSWMVAGCLIMITPIGLICVGFAGILSIIRALLR